MSTGRRVVPELKFNGKNVTKILGDYLESVSYEDVAAGSSDSMSIKLQNIDMKWLNAWYPTKGDKIEGSLTFKDWAKAGDSWKYDLGVTILDEISFSGGPLVCSFNSLAIPSSESFKTRERTKTWKKVTLKKIGSEITGRYKLGFNYDGPTIQIDSLEQTNETDSAFLSNLCDKYGLSMKTYRTRIVIYDMSKEEAKAPAFTIKREDILGDGWSYTDSLQGTYTGAKVSYKPPKKNKKDKEISIFLGLKAENAKGSRVLRINETCDSKADARLKAAAQVNKSNREMTTLSGEILANKKLFAGRTVTIKGLGRADGKYFIDKVTTELTASGVTQKFEAHKCQKTLSA